MAEETLRPNGNSQTECYNSAGNQTNNYSYVDEVSANDSDYVRAGNGINTPAGWYTDFYTVPAHSIPEGATINKVTFYARFKEIIVGSDWAKFAYKSGGTAYYSAAPNITNSFAEYSWEQATNQKTGVAWTRDDITNLLIGFSSYTEGGKFYGAICSQLRIVIDYTEAANTVPVFMHYFHNIMR